MKESTRKALDEATVVAAGAGRTVTPAGFKYHSEKLWIAVDTDGGLVVVDLADGAVVDLGGKELAVRFYAEFTTSAAPAKKKGKKS